MLKARGKAGLTQAQVAERMGTKTTAVKRLENALISGQHSPSITTIKKYLAALNCRLQLKVLQS